MHQLNNKICAAVRILPLNYDLSYLYDFHVVRYPHLSYITTMLPEKLDEILNKIRDRHGKGVYVEEVKADNMRIVTLTYQPRYFNDKRPFHDFAIWVESMWRHGLADYRRLVHESTRC